MGSKTDSESNIEASKNVPWFKPGINEVGPAFRQLLEEYSGIPPDFVRAHIVQLREKAWQTFPYPCIGQFNFLYLSIAEHDCYQRVLDALKQPTPEATLLDLGCCFAQDIRKLVYDGALSERLYACDIEPRFIDLGYELFLDKTFSGAHFFAANIFEDGGGKLTEKEGTFDFIHAGSFLHLFDREKQIQACRRMCRLLKPQDGSTVFGRQVGNVEAKEVPNMLGKGTLSVHNPESFEGLWREVSETTAIDLKVKAVLDTGEGMDHTHWTGEGCRRLKFEVTRLS